MAQKTQQMPSSHLKSSQLRQSTLAHGPGSTPQQLRLTLNAFSRLHIDQPSSQTSENLAQAQAPEQRYITHLFPPLEGKDIQRQWVLSYPLPSRQEFLEELKGGRDHNNFKHNIQVSKIGDHILDLYNLYSEVMALGGVGMVRRYELWSIVVVRMGFQRNNNGDADSGQADAHATKIKVLYEKLLESSEITLVSGIVKRTISMLQTSGQLPLILKQLMLQLVEMAHISADTMRNQGLPDMLIKQIETHRPLLQAQPQRLQLQRKALLQQQFPAPPTSLLHRQELHDPHQSSPLMQPQDAPTSVTNISCDGQPLMKGHGAGHRQMNCIIGSSRFSSGMMQNATSFLTQLRQNISRERNLAPLSVEYAVPETERTQFISTLENIHNSLTEMDKALPMYFSCTNDDKFARGILNMLDSVERQRSLLQSHTPSYIFDLPAVENLHSSVTEARGRLQSVLRQIAMLRAATLAPGRHGDSTGSGGHGSVLLNLCPPMDRIVIGNARD